MRRYRFSNSRRTDPTLNIGGVPTGWAIEGENGGATIRTLNAFVLCLAP